MPNTLLQRASARFPALDSRDFRRWWIAMAVSMTGSQMQMAALDWHIYQLTGKPIALGLLGLARLVPLVPLALLGGAVADAYDRRKVLFFTQSLLAMVALSLGALSSSGRIAPVHIYALAALSSAAVAFDNPTRQAMLPNMVPKEHLYSAISVNSVTFRIAMILGPTLAGLLIQFGRLPSIYWLNAASFAGVLLTLPRLRRLNDRDGEADQPEVSLRALREGLEFVRKTPILVSTILLDFVATFFASADSLLPALCKDVLHVGPVTYGLLRSAPAWGTLAASAVLALRALPDRPGKTAVRAVAVFGLSTCLAGISPWPWLTWVALAGIGASDTVSAIIRQTIRQTVTPDRLRGRMTSVNMIFFMGGPQLGELEAGIVAQLAGVRFSVVSGGVLCVAGAFWIAKAHRTLRDYGKPPSA